jgi:hypothetical protein
MEARKQQKMMASETRNSRSELQQGMPLRNNSLVFSSFASVCSMCVWGVAVEGGQAWRSKAVVMADGVCLVTLRWASIKQSPGKTRETYLSKESDAFRAVATPYSTTLQ